MNKYFYVLLSLFFFPRENTCFAQVADQAQVVRSITRCWRVIGHEVSPIYGLEEEEIKSYSKQKICFTADSVRMFNSVLHTPKYAIRKVNAEDYAKINFECSKKALAIMTDSVYEITITSVTRPAEAGGFYTLTNVIAFDDDFLYIVVDGVIFKLFATDRKIEVKGAQ